MQWAEFKKQWARYSGTETFASWPITTGFGLWTLHPGTL